MKSSTLTRLFSTAAVLGALAAPAAQAQEDGIFIPGASAEVSLDYVTQYFFRGYEQLDSDQGAVLQPGASMTLDVAESDDLSVSATVGTWGSIHTDTPGAGANPSSWYEQDVYGSIDFESGIFNGGVGLVYYTYPSNAANADITELTLSLGIEDEQWLGEYSFDPYVLVAVELQNNVAGDENAYVEVGGAFSLDMSEIYDAPIVWSVPMAVGFSLDNYYVDASGEDETFGYAQVGLEGTIPMSELIGSDEWVGAWDLTAGVYVLFLNSDVALTDDAGGSSDNIQYFGKLGISRSW